MRFDTLYDLLADFKRGYESVRHVLQFITIGKPIPHNTVAALPPYHGTRCAVRGRGGT